MDTTSKQTWMKLTAVGAVLVAAAYSVSGGAETAARPEFRGSPALAQLVSDEKPAAKGVGRVVKTEAQWKAILTPEQFYVLRKEGTERAFSGDYHPQKVAGVFRCAGCGLDLFRSNTQFDSGTGWPSFWQPIAGHVEEKTDADGERVEVLCARCGGHLGHVFDDGPKPTGMRYCMNAVAMKFAASTKAKK
jgi:peptide-methionine (R)-S-oxide reductase